LGFTVVDGRAAMCVIIIAASKLKVTDVLGFNPLSKDADDMISDKIKVLEEEIDEMNDEYINGVDHMFPVGPTYTFNGIEVPMFVTCSKNVSITSQLLPTVFSKMDELELFD
jgi:hypothetical protein